MPQLGEIKAGKELGYAGWARRIWLACEQCGRERWVMLESGKDGKPKFRMCRKCCGSRGLGRASGEKHGQWKGGRFNQQGYVMIRVYPNDFFYQMAGKSGYVLEHRLVVAKALGRCLHSWELVHHKGVKYPKGSEENKQDNRYPENLQLVQEMQHKQVTILENKIKFLQKQIVKLKRGNDEQAI